MSSNLTLSATIFLTACAGEIAHDTGVSFVPRCARDLDIAAMGLAGASALVARAAARRARADLRELWREVEQLHADHQVNLVRLKRVEGRQTARLGRETSGSATSNGLPDPAVDPEAWRRQAVLKFGNKPTREH